jgi:hypothetical protein
MTIERTSPSVKPRTRESILIRLTRQSWSRPIVTMAVLVLHTILGHEDYSLQEKILAGACGMFVFNVIWEYFKKRERSFPVLEWVVLQLYVFFAMPVFFEGEATESNNFQYLSRSGAITGALFAANLFILCLLAGWQVIRKRKKTDRISNVPRLSLRVMFIYGLISVVISFFITKYEFELRDAWYRYLIFILFSPTIAQVLLLFELHIRPKTKNVGLFMWSFTSIMVVQGLFSSRLDYALTPLTTVGIGLLASKQRVPKLLIVAAIAMLLVFNPAKLIYRQLTGYRTAEFGTLTMTQMSDAWMTSIEQIWGGGEKVKEKAFDATASRLNNLSINAVVISKVPQIVDYAYGEPWMAIPISAVPRFLWPNKPNITQITSDRFNVLFGMTTWKAAESSTSAYPAVADGYWNLGWAGVAITGFLAGLFWKMIYVIWKTTGRTRYVFAFLLLISLRATLSFPALVGGLFQTAMACLIVVKTLETIGAVSTRHKV